MRSFAVLAILILPGVAADHFEDGSYRCDGGWCSDGEDRVLSCSRFGCDGDTRGFPTIQNPQFGNGAWLDDEDWIIAVTSGSETKVYPLRIISGQQGWELITDTVGDEPVVVTYCPLCGSPIAFSRTVDGTALEFLNTGAIWRYDLVMYDRQTGTQWSQVAGEALDGSLHGTRLDLVQQQVTTWKDWRRSHGAPVMERPTSVDGSDLCHCPVFRPGTASLVTGVVTDDYVAAFRHRDVFQLGVANLETHNGGLVATTTGDTLHVYHARGDTFTIVSEDLMQGRNGTLVERATGEASDGGSLQRAQTRTTLDSRWGAFFPETIYFEAAAPLEPGASEQAPAPGVLALLLGLAVALRRSRRLGNKDATHRRGARRR